MSLFEQFEALQIIFCPSGVFDHIVQSAGAESVSRMMKDYGHCSAISMPVGLVAAFLTHEGKPVSQQSVHEFSRRDIARQDHTLIAITGADLTSTSPTGSVGIESPAWRRAST